MIAIYIQEKIPFSKKPNPLSVKHAIRLIHVAPNNRLVLPAPTYYVRSSKTPPLDWMPHHHLFLSLFVPPPPLHLCHDLISCVEIA
mmetsp:Transcript_46955/g.91657  ORF Transcript_46955/g.91657 Transcript_46955/m.91657 type:complete len:86 (-) Transcript_46955:1118-1375(-)